MIFTKKSIQFLLKNSIVFSVVFCWRNRRTEIVEIFYPCKEVIKMFQTPLLTMTPEACINTVSIEGIRASVVQNGAESYEILLEINSNKVMIAMQGALDMIETFEIIAVRGFIELSTSFIQTIKKLVEHLLCRID